MQHLERLQETEIQFSLIFRKGKFSPAKHVALGVYVIFIQM